MVRIWELFRIRRKKKMYKSLRTHLLKAQKETG